MMLKETLCKCMELGKNSYLLGTDEKKSRYFKNGVFLGKTVLFLEFVSTQRSLY